MKRLLLTLLILTLVVTLPMFAQFKNQGFSAGASGGWTGGLTDGSDDKAGFLARGFIRVPLAKDRLLGELGLGAGKLTGKNVDYTTEIIPIDLRFLLVPFPNEVFSPYLFAGIGALHFELKDPAVPYAADGKKDGWTGVVPAGLGLAASLGPKVALELTGGYNYTFSKDLNATTIGKSDAYWSGMIGLLFRGESGSADPDHDGLTNDQEKEFGTDKNNPDTDGDGLSDGDEVLKYKTSPTKADTDGDGLSDGQEINQYKTDPLKADTDGDGLNDGEEVLKYKTDPLKADTDGDGLTDGQEVQKYKTDPLKADTDGDGLNDGQEVMKYKTDPLKVDTDGGSVNDGVEVNRGTNPLDPKDDVPKKEEFKVEVGKSIALEGVTFATGSAKLTPESENTLEKAYNTLYQNPEVVVEIQGHTDNVGKRATNMKLSEARAASVKAWLVAKGISADRITTKGYGPDKPVAPNTTKEGKAKNRRIEFFRVK
jgi:outer membrane protein OmpA-like peptidoglycan-associated protein